MDGHPAIQLCVVVLDLVDGVDRQGRARKLLCYLAAIAHFQLRAAFHGGSITHPSHAVHLRPEESHSIQLADVSHLKPHGGLDGSCPQVGHHHLDVCQTLSRQRMLHLGRGRTLNDSIVSTKTQ